MGHLQQRKLKTHAMVVRGLSPQREREIDHLQAVLKNAGLSASRAAVVRYAIKEAAKATPIPCCEVCGKKMLLAKQANGHIYVCVTSDCEENETKEARE